MATENFTPVKWAAGILVRLRKALVHGSIANRDYEGEIHGMGDQVKINEIGPITVSDYTKYNDITWQELDDASKFLLIDQAKSFSFELDDIDRAQNTAGVMEAAQSEAAYAIGDTIDSFIAGKYTEAGSTVSALTVTAGNVIQNLSNFALKLDEANVPQQGRFLIMPPWYHQHVLNAVTQGINSTGVPKVFDNGFIVNGFVGELYGFNLLMSNNVNNNGTVYNMMALSRQAISYAGQISTIESVRRENRFATGVKGLYVYGAKVVRPNAMVSCAATKG